MLSKFEMGKASSSPPPKRVSLVNSCKRFTVLRSAPKLSLTQYIQIHWFQSYQYGAGACILMCPSMMEDTPMPIKFTSYIRTCSRSRCQGD